jgi:hypothetical protein
MALSERETSTKQKFILRKKAAKKLRKKVIKRATANY